MTETFSALLDISAGNSLVIDEFPTQRPVTRSFDVFFGLRLNKLLSKQSCGWWLETPSRHRAHYYVTIMVMLNSSIDTLMPCWQRIVRMVIQWENYGSLFSMPNLEHLSPSLKYLCLFRISYISCQPIFTISMHIYVYWGREAVFFCGYDTWWR